MSLQLREGGVYKTRNGMKVGPMVYSPDRYCQTFPFTVDHEIEGSGGQGKAWRTNGTFSTKVETHTLDLIAEWTDGPVRTVTRREVVPGVYDRVSVKLVHGRSDAVSVCLPVATLDHDALKAAAAVLLELAGALE